MEYLKTLSTPLGSVVLSSDGERLTGLWFEGQAHFGETLPPDAQEGELPLWAQAERWLSVYFSGKDPGQTPPLSPRGTPFQREVWQLLGGIPFGQVMTYGEIAAILAKGRGLSRFSPQAVGGAVARNPISLMIPCHRVVGGNGSLTGYAGGLERKEKLLALEGALESLRGR